MSVASIVLAWWLLSLAFPPVLVPSPRATLFAGIELLTSGKLVGSMGISLARILAGWIAGGCLGIALGIVFGRVPIIRGTILPVMEYLRFVPPVTLVTLFIIWFGIGETSRVALILWTVVFIVTVNVMAGAGGVREGTVWAARCMGASERQILLHVIVPETVPYMIVGLQVGLSNAFMTIVAAEMLAAQNGIGYMIWDSQIYSRTADIFVAFVALSLMGFFTDRLFYAAARRLFAHYRVA
jgi:NitT/TauT family transport system permease protein